MYLNKLFLSNAPLLTRKKVTADIQNIPGIWYINWQVGNNTIFSTFYTRIDQAFIYWGAISAVIFITAQFSPINWHTQAVLWSVLTIIGIAFTVKRTWIWVKMEAMTWVMHSWIFLLLVGLCITDLSIFLGWGQVLLNICSLWLGLSAIGYFLSGLAIGSPTFILTSMIHLLCIMSLPYVGAWQFLTTGVVMGLSVLILAEFEWKASETCAKGLDYHLVDSEVPQQVGQMQAIIRNS